MELLTFNSLEKFMGHFHDEKICQKYFEEMRFKKKIACPYCKIYIMTSDDSFVMEKLNKKDKFNLALIDISEYNKIFSYTSKGFWAYKKPLPYGLTKYKCKGCSRFFNLRSVTIFSDSRLSFKSFFLIIYMIVMTSFDPKKIAALCNVSKSTVDRMKMKIKICI